MLLDSSNTHLGDARQNSKDNISFLSMWNELSDRSTAASCQHCNNESHFGGLPVPRTVPAPKDTVYRGATHINGIGYLVSVIIHNVL